MAEFERRAGVYRFVNTITGEQYIGSTVCVPVRIARHRWELRHGRHNNDHLQRAWDKYGEAAFTVEVLEYVDDAGQRAEREQYYMDSLRPEYNLLTRAYSPEGYRHTSEAIERLREHHRAGRYEGQRQYARTWAQTHGISDRFHAAASATLKAWQAEHAHDPKTEAHREAIREATKRPEVEAQRLAALAETTAKRIAEREALLDDPALDPVERQRIKKARYMRLYIQRRKAGGASPDDDATAAPVITQTSLFDDA